MRIQDFKKLVQYVTEKQMSIFFMNNLAACSIFMKNDPNECRLHICNDTDSYDFTFFVHDDYESSKFEIDTIFKAIEK